MVYKVDGNPQLDSRDWSMYSNILDRRDKIWSTRFSHCYFLSTRYFTECNPGVDTKRTMETLSWTTKFQGFVSLHHWIGLLTETHVISSMTKIVIDERKSSTRYVLVCHQPEKENFTAASLLCWRITFLKSNFFHWESLSIGCKNVNVTILILITKEKAYFYLLKNRVIFE